jgi:hypothetical protein
VVRMLVQFSSTAFRCDRPQQDLGSSFTTLCCNIFPMHTIPKHEWGVCLRYDDNEDVPIGCSVTNDYSEEKGVIHQ